MRLLPPPTRRGRIGLYGPRHVQRLELVARLQQRGYSLAGIRDLLGVWDSGADLTALLGVDRGPIALDETPLRLTRAELVARLPGLGKATLRQATDVGLVLPDGASHFLVRSPALLGLVADGVNLGLALEEMLELIGSLADKVDDLAQSVAGLIVERIWQPLGDTERRDDLPSFFQRGRLLLLQGITSSLADRLGAALFERAADSDDPDALRAVVESVRVGVVTDSDGTISKRGAQ
jgi:DNA-binding transcriptional MerR regulator